MLCVGICAAIERVCWGPWEAEAAMMPLTYVSAIQSSGAVALLLPPDEPVAETLDPLLDRIDALLLGGGADIDPALYGEDRHPEVGETRPERDRFELELTRCVLERGMPVLGICRGMEVMNVARGGTLAQHLPDVVGHGDHRHTPGAFRDHDVRLEPWSLAARAVGAELVTVRSHHHQGVKQLGGDVIAAGWSVPDEVIEAIEITGYPFALGVLWHPEGDERGRVVEALVEAARERVGAE